MASMSLAGVLACFMGNDMGCDYFFWLLLAEWFGLGVAPPGLPSYPVVQKLSPVLTEHGIVKPVSLWTLLEEFPGLCGLLALSALGNMVHYFVMALAVIVAVFGKAPLSGQILEIGAGHCLINCGGLSLP